MFDQRVFAEIFLECEGEVYIITLKLPGPDGNKD